ncbi:glycosyltransferase [Enterococcus avium]|uniref:glycosyltransferase n=1 Tax=Enterococcus avium TaxID=33945 RepID=UPI00288DB7E4|nr:glycosyltransferase [Enterococcus avium]MDT2391066.1 glycosyltransferase [Enterococcus avium]
MRNILVVNTVEYRLNGISAVIFNLYNETKRKFNYNFVYHNFMDQKFLNELSHGNEIFKISDRKRNTLKYIFQLKRIIENKNYDIIHIHGNSSTMLIEVLAAKLANYKGRIIVHTHNTTSKNKGFKFYLNRLLIKQSDVLLACGKEAGKALYGNSDYKIISNGINTEKFIYNFDDRKKFRDEVNVSNELLIGNIGRMNNQKNQEFLLELVSHLPDKSNIKLVLIGDGPDEKKLRNMVIELNIKKRVIFLKPKEQVNYIYSGLDVLVMPSRYEGIPLVTIEAQANGLPIIISDKVDREIDITNIVTFLSIDKKEEIYNQWIDQIKLCGEMNRSPNNFIKILGESGFDIKESGKKIEELYRY